jgi:hypothetical protein
LISARLVEHEPRDDLLLRRRRGCQLRVGGNLSPTEGAILAALVWQIN